jgi:hypothetical protein
MDKRKMVGPVEVENLFSVPTGTLANWRSAKRGPKYYKINRKVLYKLEDLEDFFTSTPVLTIDSIENGHGGR